MKQKGFAPIIILVLVVLVVIGYFSYKNWAKVQTVVTPTPATTTDPTANWKTYTITTDSALNLDNYQVKLPSTWVQIEHSSSFQNTETFQDTATNFIYQLIINQDKNLNPQTKKPYSTLKEFVGLPYDVPSLMVDGQQGAQVQPRAGAETDYKVLFISKDNKATFSIELDTPRDGSKTEEGKVLFNQILSTFKFLGTNSNLKQETFSVIKNKLTFSHPSNNVVFNDNLLVFTDFTQKLPSPPEDTVVFQTSDTKIDVTGNLIIENTTIGNKSAVISENCGQVGEISNYCQTFIDIHLGNSYLRLQIPSVLYKNAKFVPIFNQILSTFKFTQ